MRHYDIFFDRINQEATFVRSHCDEKIKISSPQSWYDTLRQLYGDVQIAFTEYKYVILACTISLLVAYLLYRFQYKKFSKNVPKDIVIEEAEGDVEEKHVELELNQNNFENNAQEKQTVEKNCEDIHNQLSIVK